MSAIDLLHAQATVLADVVRERNAQDHQWGEQNHDPITWLAILTEEVGEAAQDALGWRFTDSTDDQERCLEEYREELVQVAAVALAMIECLDRGKWQR